MSTSQPDLLLFSGLPGSGRAPLATALGEKLGTPVLSRDAFADVCVSSSDGALVGAQCTEVSWELLFLTLRAMASARSGAIFEADFSRTRHKGRLESLRRETGMRVIEFHCTAATESDDSRRDSAVWPTAIEVQTDALSLRQCVDYVARRLEELRPQ